MIALRNGKSREREERRGSGRIDGSKVESKEKEVEVRLVKEDDREEEVVVEEKSKRLKPWNIKRRLKEWMDEDEVGVR